MGKGIRRFNGNGKIYNRTIASKIYFSSVRQSILFLKLYFSLHRGF